MSGLALPPFRPCAGCCRRGYATTFAGVGDQEIVRTLATVSASEAVSDQAKVAYGGLFTTSFGCRRMSLLKPKCCCRKQQTGLFACEGLEAKMFAERLSGPVLCIHDDSCHRQHFTGVRNLLASINQKHRSQSFALKLTCDPQSPDQRHRNRVSWQILCQRFWQSRAIYAACAQCEKSRQPPEVFFRRRQEYPRDIAPDILRSIAADVFIENRLSTTKGGRIDALVKRANAIQRHRETCSAWRLNAFFNAELGETWVSSAARNA